MAELFNRYFKLLVNDILIEKLDISFRAIRTGNKDPNTIELSIINLNEEHRKQLQENENSIVQLEAGYVEKSGVLFLGDTREISSDYQRPNWFTTVASGDGEKATQLDRINKSYRAGTDFPTVLEDVAKSMGDVGLGNLKEAARQGTLPTGGIEFVSGITVSGNSARVLDKLCRSAGLEWSIQNGQFQVLKAGEALKTTAVVLNPSSGLIGSPTIASDGIVTAKSLLNSDIVPGVQVHIDSRHVQGAFIVGRCEYVGDTAGNSWEVNFETKKPKKKKQ